MHGSSRGLAGRHGGVWSSVAGAAALMIAGANVASAADLAPAYKAASPIYAPYFSWTGMYIGGQVGFGWGNDHLLEYFTATNVFTNFEKRYDTKGLLGGVYGGFNYQMGNTVLGLEADLESVRVNGGWIDPPVFGAGHSTINWQASVRGRLGYAINKVLIYGTGGVSFGDVSHTYTNLFTGIVETTSTVRTGWTAGGGLEYAFTPNILVRGEYRYTDYGISRYDSITSFPGLTGTQEPRLHAVRVGAAYKF